IRDSSILLQLDVAEQLRHTRDEIPDDADRPGLDSSRLYEFLQFTIGAVIGDIDEKQLGHRTGLLSAGSAPRLVTTELSGFSPSGCLLPDLPMLERIDMPATRAVPCSLLRVRVPVVNHLNNQV